MAGRIGIKIMRFMTSQIEMDVHIFPFPWWIFLALEYELARAAWQSAQTPLGRPSFGWKYRTCRREK